MRPGTQRTQRPPAALWATLLAVLVVLTAFACGDDSSPALIPTPPVPTATPTATATATPPPPLNSGEAVIEEPDLSLTLHPFDFDLGMASDMIGAGDLVWTGGTCTSISGAEFRSQGPARVSPSHGWVTALAATDFTGVSPEQLRGLDSYSKQDLEVHEGMLFAVRTHTMHYVKVLVERIENLRAPTCVGSAPPGYRFTFKFATYA